MNNVLNVDYRFVVPEKENARVNIELLTGDYSGTIFKYGDVKLDENGDGNIYLRFVYDIIETPLDKKSLEKDTNFKNRIGTLLTDIIESRIVESENESITDNIEELGLQ